MPFVVTNAATAPSADPVAVLGLRSYFRGDANAWHDFGHVRAPQREQDLTELEIKSARLGRLAVIKKVTTEASLEFTFESISVFDQATVALHSGGPAGDGVIGAGAFYATEEFLGTPGQLLLVKPNAEAGGMALIQFYPNVLMKGDGEEGADGENESSLTFRVTILPDEDYVVPAGIAVATPAAPFGFRYATPAASVDAAIDAISDGANPA
ncbi:MAG: hypothetical protein H0U69_03715 [Trueperaceae bacterium]|nr:hypothetical protein [Trueperaceae bacterium]